MAMALWYLIAAWALATGVFELVTALRIRQVYEGEMMLASAGAVSIIFGLVMLVWPRQAMVGLSWLVGLYAAGFGMLLLVLSARLYGLAHPRPGSALNG
jgi:uncharacterized membrane protein HdeD (DUF308 family)